MYRVEKADCIEFLNSLEPGSVDLVFGSPPYCDARLYLEGGADLSLAKTAEEWVPWMAEVCTAARRACKGLCAFVVEGRTKDYRYDCTPFLLLAELHERGFHCRKPPVYKRVGIPGSGGPDWLRNDWEPIICFTRGGKLPWSDNVACGNAPKYGPGGDMSYRDKNGKRKNAVEKFGSSEAKYGAKRRKVMTRERPGTHSQESTFYKPPEVANPGNVISCNAGGGQIGHALAHENEAPFPEDLAAFFVRSFCPEGGLCVDPFSGSGTTGAVAVKWGRNFAGCDIRQSQVDLSLKRIAGEVTMFHGTEA